MQNIQRLLIMGSCWGPASTLKAQLKCTSGDQRANLNWILEHPAAMVKLSQALSNSTNPEPTSQAFQKVADQYCFAAQAFLEFLKSVSPSQRRRELKESLAKLPAKGSNTTNNYRAYLKDLKRFGFKKDFGKAIKDLETYDPRSLQLFPIMQAARIAFLFTEPNYLGSHNETVYQYGRDLRLAKDSKGLRGALFLPVKGTFEIGEYLYLRSMGIYPIGISTSNLMADNILRNPYGFLSHDFNHSKMAYQGDLMWRQRSGLDICEQFAESQATRDHFQKSSLYRPDDLLFHLGHEALAYLPSAGEKKLSAPFYFNLTKESLKGLLSIWQDTAPELFRHYHKATEPDHRATHNEGWLSELKTVFTEALDYPPSNTNSNR